MAAPLVNPSPPDRAAVAPGPATGPRARRRRQQARIGLIFETSAGEVVRDLSVTARGAP